MSSKFPSVGAYVDGSRPKSKAALKRAIADTPDLVQFDPTSALSANPDFTLSTIPDGVTLVVVGPDPYTARKWYGNVKVVNGKVKVS